MGRADPPHARTLPNPSMPTSPPPSEEPSKEAYLAQSGGDSLADRIGMMVGSQFLSAAIGLAQSLLIVRLLPKAEYGTLALVNMLLSTGRDIGMIAMPDSILFFVPKLREGQMIGLVRQSQRLLFGLSCLVSAVLITLGFFPSLFLEGKPGLLALLMVASASLLIGMPASIYANVFVATGRHRNAAGIGLFLTIVSASAALIPAALGWPIFWILALQIGVALLRLLLSEYLLRQLFQIKNQEPFPGGPKAQLRYVLPLAFTQIVGLFNQRADKFIVGLFFGAAAFAEFSVSAQELPLVSILPYSVASAMLPQLVASIDKGPTRLQGARDAVVLWHAGIRKVTLIMLPLSTFLLLLAEPLMHLLYGAAYRGAAACFRVYTSLLPLRVTAYSILLLAFGQTALMLRAQLYGIVVNVVCIVVLLSSIGLLGAPLAAVLTQVFIISYLLSRVDKVAQLGLAKIFPWKYYFKVAAISIISSVPLIIAIVFLPAGTPPGLLIGVGAIVFLSLYLLLINSFNVLAPEDKAYLSRWLKLEPLRKPS